jgi:hypothetical protein
MTDRRVRRRPRRVLKNVRGGVVVFFSEVLVVVVIGVFALGAAVVVTWIF